MKQAPSNRSNAHLRSSTLISAIFVAAAILLAIAASPVGAEVSSLFSQGLGHFWLIENPGEAAKVNRATPAELLSTTTVFSDNFSTNTSDSWTTSGAMDSSAWSITRSGADWGGRRETANQRLELTNNTNAGSANLDGWVLASTASSSFSSPYNATLSSNPGKVTWRFNMQQIRTDPGGFGAGLYGVAYILAGTSNTTNSTGSGYAVVLGQVLSVDPVRLVRYSNGIQGLGSMSGILHSNSGGLVTDFGSNYLSISVTYTPSTNTWELFVRNDGFAFVDPASGFLPTQGTAVDSTYTGTSLALMGAWWQGSTTDDQTAFFDNISVDVEPSQRPTIAAMPVVRTEGAGALNSAIANVSDAEDIAETLDVTVNGGTSATVNGVTVSSLVVHASGAVTADVEAESEAIDATFTLMVTDSSNHSSTATLAVIVADPACVTGTIRSQEAYAKPAQVGVTQVRDSLGYSVAVSGDTMVVGAPDEDSSTTGVNSSPDEGSLNSGAAYIFVRTGSTWLQQAYLKASNTGADDGFGRSVAISGDTVVVGASGEDSNATGVNGDQADNSADSSGAAYVFTREGSTSWSQQAYLKASNSGNFGDGFGRSVAISGDTLVIGAAGEDSNATGVNGNPLDNSSVNSGAAYVFTREGSIWSQQSYLKASNTAEGDLFGFSVAVSGDAVVVGAWKQDAFDQGAAYVFARNGSTWSQEAFLKASNLGGNDGFGLSVSISGKTVVVGAYLEASNATGVNGDGSNNSYLGAGAAYVFTRSGSTWSQQAYLKASNTWGADNFGISVSVSGDTVVVGAHEEDSNATGVDGNQGNNAAFSAGAAYVFVRSGNTWSQQAYLKASNTDANDWFGWSVAVSGSVVVVGANQEDSSSTGMDSTPNEANQEAGAAYAFGTSCVVAPEMDVRGTGQSIDDGDDSPDANDNTDFGSANVTGVQVVRTFTIANIGIADLTIAGVSVGGTDADQFSVTSPPGSLVPGPTGTTTFEITFDPTSPGVKNAVISVGNNDPDENPYTFAIRGEGFVTYTVTYNGNGNTGGSAPVDADSPYAAGTSVGVLGPGDLVKTDYQFDGWNTAPNGSGTNYNPAQQFVINANTILHAQWLETRSLNGRVLTPNGVGLQNTMVSVTSSTGVFKSVLTNSLGHFSVDGLLLGGTYKVAVHARRYRFESKSMIITDNMGPLEFFGLE